MKLKLYERIYEDIRSDILSGKLKQGDQIPTEMQLVGQYSVSRITAGTAVKKLADKGFVRRITKRGTFVSLFSSGEKRLKIAIVLPYNNIATMNIVRGAQSAAMDMNTQISFYNSENNMAVERKILKTLLYTNIDGIIIYPSSEIANIDVISRHLAKRIKVVFVDTEIVGTDCPLVTSDNQSGMFNLTDTMLKKGYKKPSYFGLQANMLSTERDRFTGFALALLKNNITMSRDYIYNIPDKLGKSYTFSNIDNEEYISLCKNILAISIEQKNLPDIIFCTNDYLAISMLSAIKSLKINDVRKIDVCGFDNIELPKNSPRPIATATQNYHSIGVSALSIINKLCQNEDVPKVTSVQTDITISGRRSPTPKR